MQLNLIKLTLNQLLQSGAHLGYTRRFLKGQVKPYLLGFKGELNIFNLKYVQNQLKTLLYIILNLVSSRLKILVVNHYPEMAILKPLLVLKRCFLLEGHWMGGFLTNFKSLRLYTTYSIQKQFQLWALTSFPALTVFLNTTTTNESLKESLHLNIPTAAIIGANTPLFDKNLYSVVANNQSTQSAILYANLIRNAVMKGLIKEKFKVLKLV